MPSPFAVSLPDLPFAGDHAILGRPVAPAVELLNAMLNLLDARQLGSHPGPRSGAPSGLGMADVRFPRFLPVDEISRCRFELSAEERSDGLRCRLTSHLGLRAGMARQRTHAELTLAPQALPPLPATTEAGADFQVPAERVYRELIPLGPHFHNLRGNLRLGRRGAWGTVASPAPPHPAPSRAGCPYLLDGAMHLACLWGQRYAGTITYPMAFSRRAVLGPVAAGRRQCRVRPVSSEAGQLTFDVWLYDDDAQVGDAVAGLVMVPLAGDAAPPAWIREVST